MLIAALIVVGTVILLLLFLIFVARVLVNVGGDGGGSNVFAAFIAQLLAQNRNLPTNGPGPAGQAPPAAPPEGKT